MLSGSQITDLEGHKRGIAAARGYIKSEAPAAGGGMAAGVNWRCSQNCWGRGKEGSCQHVWPVSRKNSIEAGEPASQAARRVGQPSRQ